MRLRHAANRNVVVGRSGRRKGKIHEFFVEESVFCDFVWGKILQLSTITLCSDLVKYIKM